MTFSESDLLSLWLYAGFVILLIRAGYVRRSRAFHGSTHCYMLAVLTMSLLIARAVLLTCANI